MKTKAKITFELVDVTAKQDSNLLLTDKQDFVDVNDLKEDELEETLYGTLEKNQFLLDGTRRLMSETLDDMGWWSNQMSNQNGIFATPLVLEISFSDIHTSLGLTLIFSKAGDYCSRLKIDWYNLNNELISSKIFEPNNYYYVCNNTVKNYKKIVITFYSTNNPYRYLKLYKILYGAEEKFEGNNLISANILEEIDLLSSEISVNTLDFTAYSSDDEFNIINPQGSYELLQERQPLIVTEELIKENREKQMGTFYLDTWSNEKNKTMKITAIDLIGIIDKTDFYGGIYENVSFGTIIESIMSSANVSSENYEVQSDLRNIMMTGYLPICSHRKALQQICFAVGAVVDCSRGDKIKIYTINTNTIKSTLTKSDVIQNSRKIEQNDLVTAVTVIAHTYLAETEQEKLFDDIVSGTLIDITFTEPAYNLSCVNGTIVESNCNHAIVSCSANSNVIVYGYKYKDTLQSFTVELEGLSNNQKRNTLKVETAYFANMNNSEAIATRILNYYTKSYKTSVDLILSDETLGDAVILESDFEQELLGNITKADINLTGGFKASIEMSAAKIREGG